MARIVIVEPHVDIRSLLEIVIVRLGHEPVVYEQGGDSVVGVDAAVIEPGEDVGLTLARLLRGQGVPVVFTSIFPADDEALSLGPAAYLIKPFALYTLENALAAALANAPVPSAA